PVSVRRNVRSGVSMRRTHAVFWENGPPVSSVAPVSSAVSSAAAAAISASETSMTLDASGVDSLIAASQATRVDDAPQEAPGPFVRRLTEQPAGRRLFHDLPVG